MSDETEVAETVDAQPDDAVDEPSDETPTPEAQSAEDRIAQLQAELEAERSRQVPVEEGVAWQDEQGNWVTPELEAFEAHQWAAEVSAYERTTGKTAAVDVAPEPVVAPVSETVDHDGMPAPEDAYPDPPQTPSEVV